MEKGKTATFTSYVLYSDKYEKHYSGFTADIEERLKSHNYLSNKDWTKRYRPWKLIHAREFATKFEAMKYERWLKTGKGREFIKIIQH